MTLQYLGHSCFLIQKENASILIDPFLKENPLAQTTIESLPKIDFIFITHGHFDHVGDTLEIAQSHQAKIFCNTELSTLLKQSNQNVSISGFSFGNFISLPFGKVKMVFALHSSSMNINHLPHYAGLAAGFVFDIDGIRIYHAGDTAISIEMSLLKQYNLDIAILPIGGFYTMGIEDISDALDMIQPKLFIPMHYNTFPAISVDFNTLLNPYGAVKIMSINETISLK